jgi:O-antigen/teichoic acid export membrane protein
MQAAHRVAKNTGILYLRMAITVFISLYSTRLILSALGVADFGLFNLVGGVIAMLGFLNSSMASATQRFILFAQGEGDVEKVKRIFNMSSILHWGIAILVLLFLEIAGYYFFNGFLKIPPERIQVAKLIYQFMVISTLLTIISVPYEAVITSHENMIVYAVIGIIEAVLKLAIAFSITYTRFDHLIMYGFLMAVLSIFLLIIKWIYCHRVYQECKLKLWQYYDKPLLNEISLFAGFSFMTSFSSMVSFYGQSILLNYFFGLKVIAAQTIALQVAANLNVFSSTLLKVLNPVIIKFEGASNRFEMIKTLFIGSKFLYLLQGIFYIPVIIILPIILKLWIKNIPEFTIIFCRLLLINNLVYALSGNLIDGINAVGKIKKYQLISSFFYLSSISLSFLFFKLEFQPYYIYISMIIFTSLHVINEIYFAYKTFELSIKDYFYQFIFKMIIITLVTFIFSLIPLLFFKIKSLIFIGVFFLSILTFSLSFWLIAFNKNERNQIIEFFINFQHRINKLITFHKKKSSIFKLFN